MAVLQLDITAAADPTGSVLASFTDEDVETFEMRRAENELGSGQFTIRRNHPDATAANLAGGNYVTVTIPIIDADPIFGFWLDEQNDTVLSESEEGGEVLTRGGPGTLAILGRALLLNQFYNGPIGGMDRGNVTIPGFWTWTAEPYGAILVRLVEEGQYQPGSPLGDVVIDFNRTVDSNGDDWPDIIETIQFDIGVDGLEVYQRLIESGHLFVVADPDLAVHGYGTRPGTNRANASFATGKVRFVKGTNIETELVRAAQGIQAYTHALVKGKDLVYRQVVSPSYTSGPARWVSVEYPESNDTDLLDKVGAHTLSRSARLQDQIEFEVLPGDDEATGLYLPFKHFDVGDTVRVHTGSAAWDYNEANEPIAGIRLSLGEVSDDQTDDLAAKSLHVVVELNGGPTSDGVGRDVGVTQGGCSPCPGDFPYVPPGGPAYAYDGCINNAAGAGTGGVVAPEHIQFYNGDEYSCDYTVTQAADDGGSGIATFWHEVLPGSHQFGEHDFGHPSGTVGPVTETWTVSGLLAGGAPFQFEGFIDTDVFKSALDFQWCAKLTLLVAGPENPATPPTSGTTPPSAGQMTPPTPPVETPDGATTVFTVPFSPARYAPGSLHVEFNGSRLENGVDFEETNPAVGTFTFLTFTPPADSQIVVWYQQGTA